jgi:hypothetical protein
MSLGFAPSCMPDATPSPWSAEHEALYWKAVPIIAKDDACRGTRLTGIKAKG